MINLFKYFKPDKLPYVPLGSEGSTYDQIQTEAVLRAREKQLKVKNGCHARKQSI